MAERQAGGRSAPTKGPARTQGPPAKRPPPARKAGEFPENVVVRRTSEIDPKDPLASGASAPLRGIWLTAAREARDERKVVIDLIGEGRGVIAIPVAFEDEREAVEVMAPALDALVTHCAQASPGPDKPVMVDLQELIERLKDEAAGAWIKEHGWFEKALTSRELLCMYVFSPGYLLEFATAIGEKQGFGVRVSSRDPGFYDLNLRGKGDDGLIIWNWARAIGDVIAGGHAWSYFGMLLALAPEVAKRQGSRPSGSKGRAGEEE